MEEIGFYADLFWVKMRAIARGELKMVKKLESSFPKLLDKDFSSKVEYYARVRDAMAKAFTREELQSILIN